jgi:RNA-directed DNA polymerase
MSLSTPENIRTLQRGLYFKAKTEPDFRFYTLYDKVWRIDILHHAWRLVRANRGAPGVDGVDFAQIEAAGVDEWLLGLREDLRTRQYRPQPVRRVMIPKPGGGERPLGIPTLRDRVAQMAAKLVLEPIFEADFEPTAYGYRPGRSAVDAIKRVHGLLCGGYTDVVDADLSKYFDTIPHRDLLRCVARRVVDRGMLRLIKLWLKAPVEDRGPDGLRCLTGGRTSSCGTPQGGVISPLLANIYMNRMLKHWQRSDCGTEFRAEIVAYADDFVILSRGRSEEALEWAKRVLERMGLTLNEKKTTLRNAREEQFNFLGYSFGRHVYWRTGHAYLGASPSTKSVGRLKESIGELLQPRNKGTWEDIRDQLNMKLRGWSEYFSYGTLWKSYKAVDHYVCDQVRDFLAHRHKAGGRGARQFPWERIFGQLGVAELGRLKDTTSCA